MKLLITTSTLPASDSDEVPAFVKEQAIHLKKSDSDLVILIHAPHNHYSQTSKYIEKNDCYEEVRFHYFWPFRFELLAGRGIMPALSTNRLLYAQIPFFVAFQFVSLWRLARKERPDLLYAHWFTPQAISTALVSKITGIPFVFTTHASDVSVLTGMPFARRLVRRVCRRAEAYTAVSERTAEKLKQFFNEDEWADRYSRKLAVIPMGVELDVPPAGKGSLDRIRRKYRIDQRPMVLYIGRLAEKKGVAYLLEALSLLPGPLCDSFQLVIAGDGQLKGELGERARSLHLRNVIFTGYVFGEEKETLFALAEFLCLPSIIDSSGDSEGFPVVLMEALAAGKVILASNVSGGEAVLRDGESGFLFAQKSPADLAATLTCALSLTSDERTALKKRSRQLSTQFSWETISNKYHHLLEGAASSGL